MRRGGVSGSRVEWEGKEGSRIGGEKREVEALDIPIKFSAVFKKWAGLLN